MSSGQHILSRLDFVGNQIWPTTPNIVIYEIAICHGISADLTTTTFANKYLIQAILTTPIRTVTDPPKDDDLKYIARYVNPLVNWKESSLIEAFKTLWRTRGIALGHEDVSSIDVNFIPGLPTPDYPHLLTACCLYSICLRHEIQTWPEMSYDQLAFAVKCLLLPQQFMAYHISNSMSTWAKKNFAQACLNLTRDLNSIPEIPAYGSVDHKVLTGLVRNFNHLENLQQNFSPCQPGEAVALVALRWSIDITTSRYPFDEFYFLQLHGENNYKPIDPIMNRYYKLNPRLYCLEVNFNPLFGEKYYSRSSLRQMVSDHGWDINEHDDPYNCMCEIYFCNNFYHGIRPGIKNKTSPFEMENLEELDSNQVVIYGNPADGYTFFTYSELADYFRINRAFLHPLERGYQLSSNEVSRLKVLSSDVFPEDSERGTIERNKLASSISYVDAFTDSLNSNIKEFLLNYENEPVVIQLSIQQALVKLLEMGYYMRNWTGPDDPEGLPVAVMASGRNIFDIMTRTTDAIGEWENSLGKLSIEWRTCLNDLPLVKFEGGYVYSDDSIIGKTIGEKVNLVKSGESSNNVQGTCIKMSSGWIICTAHRYMCMIGMPPPFAIGRIKYFTH